MLPYVLSPFFQMRTWLYLRVGDAGSGAVSASQLDAAAPATRSRYHFGLARQVAKGRKLRMQPL